jgi:hypothetical protein
MKPVRRNLKIYKGSTFIDVIRIESGTRVAKPIQGITRGGVTTIHCNDHGLPLNWRFKISGVLGTKEMNTSNYLFASDVTANSIEISNLDSSNYTNYISGGYLKYNLPEALSGATARMQIRESKTSDIALLDLTTENNMLVFEPANGLIAIDISDAITSIANFKKGVYSLEISNNGIVSTILTGSIKVEPEITRPD